MLRSHMTFQNFQNKNIAFSIFHFIRNQKRSVNRREIQSLLSSNKYINEKILEKVTFEDIVALFLRSNRPDLLLVA